MIYICVLATEMVLRKRGRKSGEENRISESPLKAFSSAGRGHARGFRARHSRNRRPAPSLLQPLPLWLLVRGATLLRVDVREGGDREGEGEGEREGESEGKGEIEEKKER